MASLCFLRSGFLILLALPACNLVSGIDDFDFRDPPGTGGAGGNGACVTPVVRMQIAEDTNLCGGTHSLAVAPGEAAIEVIADGVTLSCEGTILEGGVGTYSAEDDDPQTAGIRIAKNGVTVRGCAARGYRHGIVVSGASDVVLDAIAADDNFTDPASGWVGDVRGGGVLLENATGGRVENSTFARNWNGIELRGSRGVTVAGNVADHCSNAGALLLDSHDNSVRQNDFQWAVRGAVTWPDVWYGIDTKDSAGIVLDQGSTNNRIEENDVRYGGDGIFVRGLYGRCPSGNVLAKNDLSFSPHNGVECTCDNNVIEDNVSDASNYGIWTGGGDGVVIRRNKIRNSRVDGISIQIASGRHVVVDDNEITGSARVGILFSGRAYQEWDTLDEWSETLANASHLIVQRNEFVGNTEGDLFATSARSLTMISNCVPSMGTFHLGNEVEVTRTAGTCQAASAAEPPTADLEVPPTVALGTPVVLDASASRSPNGGLTFTWLVQASGPLFWNGEMPPIILGGSATSAPQLTLDQPGAYDVDVTVDDGVLAAGAYRQVLVAPVGQPIGESKLDWDYDCSCIANFSDEPGGVDGTFVRVVHDEEGTFSMFAPAARDLALDASAFTTLGFFLRAQNDNLGGWQEENPVVVLGNENGTIFYRPVGWLMPREDDEWIFVAVPLSGGTDWVRTMQGGSLSDVDWIEIRSDTFNAGVTIDVDAVTFY